MFIDTHCHMEDENFSADRAEVLSRAKVAGVEQRDVASCWCNPRRCECRKSLP